MMGWLTVKVENGTIIVPVGPEGHGSQMPRHLVSDAHEGMKEIPTVPTWLWSVSLCVTWPACLSQGVCVCAVHCLCPSL